MRSCGPPPFDSPNNMKCYEPIRPLHSTSQIALGTQLPRDKMSATGRERAAAVAAERALLSAYEPLSATTSPERADRSRKNHLHHGGFLANCREYTTGHEGYPHAEIFSQQGRGSGRAGVPALGSGGGVSSDEDAGGRGRNPFPSTRHVLRTGGLPSPPMRAEGEARFDRRRERCSVSLGRSRESRYGRRRRHRRAEISRGSTARGGRCGGSCSWSPPRTRTGTASFGAFPTASAAGSNASVSSSNTNPFDPESREGGQGRRSYSSSVDDEEQQLQREWRASSRPSEDVDVDSGAYGTHRPVSPLMLPLDPYRSSRTIVRAGTAVSLRDAAAAERASRGAARYIRRASEARAGTERFAAGDTAPVFSSPDRGRGWGEQRRPRQKRGGDGETFGGDRKDFRIRSGTVLDVHEEEERWDDKIRRSLPSVAVIERELKAIKRADAAMREEQLAQVHGNSSDLVAFNIWR